MSCPFCCVMGGGDQENSTALTPGSASNITGAPDGAINLSQGLLMSCFVKQRDPQ